MFISFEGIDGSGKSTQIKLLKKYLEGLGYDVITLREPGGTVLSEKIREMLLSHKYEIQPVTELLLFEAARSNLVEEIIKPAIAAGKIVLCDRFYDSTTAYQGYGRDIPVDDVLYCHKIATNGLKPDITFFLNVSITTSNYRSINREVDRIEASGDDFFEKVKYGFHEIAKSEPERVFVINSELKIEETQMKIINILKNKFPDFNF